MNNIKKQIIYVLIAVMAPFGAITQLEITNQYAFGGDGSTVFEKALTLNNGGYLIGFNSTSSASSGNLIVPAYGISYGVLNYYNENDDLVWSKSFGGGGIENTVKLAEVSDGIIIGLASFSNPSGNKSEPAYGWTDGWVLKLDFDGEIVWQKSFGGNQNDVLFGLISAPDNSIYVAHRSESGASGNRTAPLKGMQDFWIVKTDGDGEIIWDRSYGSDGSDILFGIDQLSNGNIILSGVSVGSTVSYDKTEPPFGPIADIWILAIDPNGDVVWDKTIGGEGVDGRGHIVVIQDTIYLLGSSTSGVSGLRTEPLKGMEDLWLTKLDENGTIISTHYYGGNNYEVATGITKLDSNRILLCSRSDSDASIDKSESNRGNDDFWGIIVDYNGNIIAEKTLGGDETDELMDGMLINNTLLLFGHSRSDISGDKTIPKFNTDFSNVDVWILELDASTLEIIEHTLPLPNAYPNPVQDFLHLDISNNSVVERLEVYNSAGMLVSTLQPNQQEAIVKLDFSNLAQGLYTVVVIGDNGVSMVKVVK
jgi:hypothetical protein